MEKSWKTYRSEGFFDESMTPRGNPRAAASQAIKFLHSLSSDELNSRRVAAELAIKEMGISFTVYTEGGNIDRAWPFDFIPRIITSREWRQLSLGLLQRMRALNCFIDDVYNKQKILSSGIVPAEIVLESNNYLEPCVGVNPAFAVWAHICGSDIVRDHKGQFFVLEDNLRVPSGVSYMIENREITNRVLPELFENYSILPLDDYPLKLYETLAALSPRARRRPNIVVLTPGIYNSAYFEHAYLAHGMGAELVEGSDLFVGEDDCVYMRSVDGPPRVEVIYRRINEDFMDPDAFREDSVVGVRGLIRSWKAAGWPSRNAPGAGVADDKVIYAFVPDMIRFYLKEKPLVKMCRPTCVCVKKTGTMC